MQSATLVDWLAITYKWGSLPEHTRGLDHSAVDRILLWLYLQPEEFSLDKARHGYVMGLKAKDTVTVYLSEPGSEMGVHVVYPGSALTPGRTRQILRHMAAHQGKCTRIDLAVDIKDGLLTPDYLRGEYVNGLYEGRQREWALMTGGKGATLYIGSRSSEKYLRIYDKAAQMHEDGAWLRIELECKGEAAKAGAWLMRSDGNAAIPEIINGFVKFKTREWVDAMGECANMDALKGEKKMTDTKRWLLEQIAPILARIARDNPELWEELGNEVKRLMVDNDNE